MLWTSALTTMALAATMAMLALGHGQMNYPPSTRQGLPGLTWPGALTGEGGGGCVAQAGSHLSWPSADGSCSFGQFGLLRARGASVPAPTDTAHTLVLCFSVLLCVVGSFPDSLARWSCMTHTRYRPGRALTAWLRGLRRLSACWRAGTANNPSRRTGKTHSTARACSSRSRPRRAYYRGRGPPTPSLSDLCF